VSFRWSRSWPCAELTADRVSCRRTAEPGLAGGREHAAGRVRSEASFAALCGASPVDASSGKQIRHRLNRGGDRQANSRYGRSP
jgi:transposase